MVKIGQYIIYSRFKYDFFVGKVKSVEVVTKNKENPWDYLYIVDNIFLYGITTNQTIKQFSSNAKVIITNEKEWRREITKKVFK